MRPKNELKDCGIVGNTKDKVEVSTEHMWNGFSGTTLIQRRIGLVFIGHLFKVWKCVHKPVY